MLTYLLSKEGPEPLYAQLYEAIRRDILSGGLKGGERLPSKRQLAEHLNISKITVETAYAQLLAEGYIAARERSGYFVEQMPLALQPAQPQTAMPEKTAVPVAPAASTPETLFPFSVWARLMRSVLLDEGPALLQAVPSGGLPALREAIAQELRQSRGMQVLPEQILIGAGAEYFYNLLIQFFGRERRYALEELGHQKIARVYAANGVEAVPIAMDADGVCVDALRASGASILHITPSHHYPTGIVTPISRRQSIMAWLMEAPDRYAVEDDYDSEFRFSGRPIPTMQSMDGAGRVIYMNTFSKTIAPALRISYMILPRQMLASWREKMGFYSCTVPSFEQLTLTRFLSGLYFERHLNRMKKYYRGLRQSLREILAEPEFAELCTVRGAEAGLHFVLQFRTQLQDFELEKKLRQAGLEAPLLSSFYVGPPRAAARGCVVIGYADLDAEKFRQSLKTLRTLL